MEDDDRTPADAVPKGAAIGIDGSGQAEAAPRIRLSR